MRSKVSIAALLALTATLATPRRAAAVPYDFSAGSWIIPMDVCNQPSQPFNGSSFSGTTPTSSVYGGSCPEGSLAARDGILKAYGLVYRLLQNNVPVYYILNTNKATIDGPDFTITNLAGTPVKQVTNKATGASSEFMNVLHLSMAYRGAPFIISAADVPTVENLFATDNNFKGVDPRTGRTIFQDVYIHTAKVNILQAPVRALLQQTPPKIALMDIGGAAIGVLEGYLKDAGLYATGSTAMYPTIGSVFTSFNDVTDFTTSNGLTAGNFQILWAPHWEGNYGITTAERDAVTQKITAFIDNGHPFLGQCAAVATLEGANSPLSYGDEPATSYGHLITTATSTTVGLKTNVLSQPSFPAAGQSIVVNPDPLVKAWIDPLTQVGDYPMNINVLSWTFDFQPDTGIAYKPFVQSYVQSATGSGTTNKLQIETVAHKDGNPNKGLVIYLGGHSYGSQGSTCSGSCSTFNQYNTLGLERLILNSLIFLGQQPSQQELTRSAPIVYESTGVDSALNLRTYVGSYVQQTMPSAAYPPWDGHFREYAANKLNGTNVTAFNSSLITANWDAAVNVDNQGNADTRKIFTVKVPNGPAIDFTTANSATLGIAAATITNIRKGGLGGIDHSIPAIIGPSTNGLAGSANRPTVAYFGALDGMLHAILVYGSATVNGHVLSPGDEMWAFIPPSQLNKVVAQTGGVDGSPVVGDAFIDIGGGVKQWRTLLAISDGNYTGGTIDAIDITDPVNPVYRWTASDTFTTGGKTYVMGRAQGAALGQVTTPAGVKYAVFVATDNTGGSWGNGFNMYALDAGSGAVIWRFNHTYANDTMHNDVPGMVAAVDAVGDGGANDTVLFADIEGKVWKVPAATGAGGTFIYDAAFAHGQPNSINYPVESAIVLYRDPTTSHLSVLGVTGGADWVPVATLSKVFKVDVQTSVSADLFTLASGERVYASPTVFGNQVYFLSSNGAIQAATGTDFQATGALYRINLGGTNTVTNLATLKQGASEVAVDSNGNIVAASAAGLTQNANSGRNTSQAVVKLQNLPSKPIKTRAWLDPS